MPIGFSPDRADVVESGSAIGTVTATTTAVEVFVSASRLASRQILTIYNPGPTTVYIGSVGVTAANGTPLFKQSKAKLALGDRAYFAITASGSQVLNVEEFA